ncbi:thioesterase [Cohnella kolymensis]|uniref:Thioesterase n=1 Tax=Cohnella kolymensis TaxID=1590652 RepID=A0ABR5A885_9BACL|nr:thioesterase family protein [Cohnella kolymensis]KIL37274.1 thioesterase [Cohnella kolymensis]
MRQIPYIVPDAQGWLEKFNFSVPIKVRYFETDMLGHVNNVSYFIYFEQGRVDYLDHLQLAEDLFNEENVCVVADMHCHYLSQIFIKEPLKLGVRIAKLGRSSFDLEYSLVEAASGQLKAAARGTMVYISKKTGASIPIPDAVREQIISAEGANLA